MNTESQNPIHGILTAFVEALKPHIEQIVQSEYRKAMDQDSGGVYVTAEEFREYERRLKSIEELGVPESIGHRLKDIEGRIDSIGDEIDRALDDKDFSRDIRDAIDDYDLDDKISDYMKYNHDIRDDIRDEIHNMNLVDSDEVLKMISAKLAGSDRDLVRKFAEALTSICDIQAENTSVLA